MVRPFTHALVSVAFSALLLSGCGPTVVTRPTTASSPGASNTKPYDPAEQKPISRGELTRWLTPRGLGNGRVERTALADVKKRFGPPDDTREVRTRGPQAKADAEPQLFTVYTYKRLTVDADGSKKVDSETRIFFGPTGHAEASMTEYAP